ncbi:MAG: glycoside hydrolase family 3 C-terminal domain-containing protein [Natrialbaceae archaeon]|nr:glycoside hydrolase family 3 C-terminal domain-containing protein [Natrialbaceae archaeon]
MAGRPLTLPQDAGDAVVMAYYPGTAGGQAIADILTGETNPAGRLPISWPRSIGQLPVRFNYLEHLHPLGDDEHPDSYNPRYPFGHGLSYTNFAYRSLDVEPTSAAPDETVTVTVTVENVGDRQGEETVLVYGHDVVSSRVTPVRTLVAVERVTIEAGDSVEVSIPVDVDLFGVVHGQDRRVEPGTIQLAVEDLETSFEIRDH